MFTTMGPYQAGNLIGAIGLKGRAAAFAHKVPDHRVKPAPHSQLAICTAGSHRPHHLGAMAGLSRHEA